MGIIVAVVYEQEKILLKYQDIMLILCLKSSPSPKPWIQNLYAFIQGANSTIIYSRLHICNYWYLMFGSKQIKIIWRIILSALLMMKMTMSPLFKCQTVLAV